MIQKMFRSFNIKQIRKSQETLTYLTQPKFGLKPQARDPQGWKKSKSSLLNEVHIVTKRTQKKWSSEREN